MRNALTASLVALACSSLPAQVQAPVEEASSTHTYSDPLGFSYAIPADWEAKVAQASTPDAKETPVPGANADSQKKGVGCAQIGLTARHGDPVSVIVEVSLPFKCYGQKLAEAELPGFASGAAESLKQNFDSGDSHVATYSLGTHTLWAEQMKGNFKGQPDKHYTIEISCALLSKTAVCWLTMAADDASLAVFENGAVALEGDSPTALVPAGTFK